MNKEKLLKKILYMLVFIYGITVIAAIITNLIHHDTNALMMTGVACLTPLLVPVFFRLMQFKPVYEIYIISTLFTYFASLIGSGFGGYALPFFDKVLHFSSGLFLTIAAMLLFYWIKRSRHFKDPQDWPLFLVFINAVNMATALLWEFYEYAMLIFFNNDCINHTTTGVHDSMTDMLCATCAGLFITTILVHHHNKGKEGFIEHLCSKFYTRNIKKTEE